MIHDGTVRWVMYAGLLGGSLVTYYANKQWRRDPSDKTIMRLAATMFTVMLLNVGLILSNIWAIDEVMVGVIVLVEAYHVAVTVRLYQLIANVQRRGASTSGQHEEQSATTARASETPIRSPGLESGVADV
jgi:hypothetical protein